MMKKNLAEWATGERDPEDLVLAEQPRPRRTQDHQRAETSDDIETIEDVAETLDDVRQSMMEAIGEASTALRRLKDTYASHEAAAAEQYWLAHIKSALGGMGYSTHATTMDDTIDSLWEKY